MTTTPDTSSFEFSLSAIGTFYVDWGDGTEEVIESNGSYKSPSHTYATVGTYVIRLGGRAVAYTGEVAISLEENWNLAAIDGCLGCVFPTLADGSQPNFFATFSGTVITKIPEKLFAGISGVTTKNMFFGTFASVYITSIPENLFAGLDVSAPLAEGAFMYTFLDCWYLTGPSARINGRYLYEIWPDATGGQFYGMYSNCEGLSDYANIPDAWK